LRRKQFTIKTNEWGFKKNTNKTERKAILQNVGRIEKTVVVDMSGRKHNRLKLERWQKEINAGVFGNASTNELAEG
jgi:hypothetical protein